MKHDSFATFLRLSVCALAGSAGLIHAQTRASANYSITTEISDSGGARAASANFTNHGSAGGITGISTVASPSETAKQGYIAQLYEVTALNIAASPTTVNETATRQLSGSLLLDDLTTISVPASSIAWSIVSGPISGISTGGLATAATVYQNTAATVQGIYSGNTGTLGLTVLDNIPDNFGAYAGDGLGDGWQVQYFGQPPNVNAGPSIDFDHDGRDNRLEYLSGYSPVDGAAFFTFDIVSKVGSTATLRLSKVIGGTTYEIQKNSPDLNPINWSGMQTLNPSSEILNVNVQDTNAVTPSAFYRVNLSRP